MKMIGENNIEEVCEQAGVRFDGIQKTPRGEDEQLVLFTDPLTGSTLALEKKNFTSPKVQAKIAVHRRQYPKDIEMTSDIIAALDFIVKKYHTVPKQIITAAAHNAAITIQKFLDEEKSNGSTQKVA